MRGYLFTRLGYAHFICPPDMPAGEFRVTVGKGTFFRSGGDPNYDYVRLGLDRDGNYDAPAPGRNIGATSECPDIVFVPKPAGMLLLGAVTLTLRRR